MSDVPVDVLGTPLSVTRPKCRPGSWESHWWEGKGATLHCECCKRSAPDILNQDYPVKCYSTAGNQSAKERERQRDRQEKDTDIVRLPGLRVINGRTEKALHCQDSDKTPFWLAFSQLQAGSAITRRSLPGECGDALVTRRYAKRIEAIYEEVEKSEP